MTENVRRIHREHASHESSNRDDGAARLRIMKSLGGGPSLVMLLESATGEFSRIQGRFVREHPNGIVVELTTALGPGVVLRVAGEPGTAEFPKSMEGRYRVASSEVRGIAKYHVHLSVVQVAEMPRSADQTKTHGKTQGNGTTQQAFHAASQGTNTERGNAGTQRAGRPQSEEAPRLDDRREPTADYYEVLQVSRTADVETIHRVFHLLAQRHHPDNHETGDEGRFRLLVEAHRVLSDPEKRAAHDLFLAGESRDRVRLFDSMESSQGVEGEIRKRDGILRLLYTRRLTEPHNPAMTGRDFVHMLEVPAEHLEFPLWFLRTRGLVTRSDNNKFEITWEGVLAFEESQAGHKVQKRPLTLPAPVTVAM